jgi:ABC-type transporter Mla subunit MlaD
MADAAQASEESSKHQAQTNDVLRAISNELMHLRADLNRFIDSAPRLNSDIRRRLSEIEAKIAGTGG